MSYFLSPSKPSPKECTTIDVNSSRNNRRLEYQNIFTLENNLRPLNQKQLLYVRKLNDNEKSIGDIEKEIYDSFNDPNKYFNSKSPIRIGKNIELKNIGIIEKQENRSSLTRLKKNNNDFSVTEKSCIATKTALNKQNNNTNNKINNNHNYELVDNNILKNIFDSYRKDSTKRYNNKNNSCENNYNNNSNNDLINSNSKNNINDSKSIDIIDENLIKNLPINLSRSLSYQNKILNTRNTTDKEIKKMSHFISKKINSDEKDLMINKVDLYKYKKEILNEISNDNHYEDIYGKFRWNINLRRPENFHGIRMSYVNINNDRNPFWKVVVDKYPNDKELAIKPNFNLNNKEFIKFANTKGIKKSLGKIKNLKSLDGLSIKGSNLLDFEYKREMSCKGKKILHKVFVENGKVILDQDINNVFGDETLYKSYDKRKCSSGYKNKNHSRNYGNNLGDDGHYKGSRSYKSMTIPNEDEY